MLLQQKLFSYSLYSHHVYILVVQQAQGVSAMLAEEYVLIVPFVYQLQSRLDE